MKLHRLLLALAAAAAVAPCAATTTVGSATLIDTATVHAGTVAVGPFLTYAGGGNGNRGTANGATWTEVFDPAGVGAALATADHAWGQYDPALQFVSPRPTNTVIVIPAIDHGWTTDNTGAEFWEPFEFRVFGCLVGAGCIEEGRIAEVWARGVDDSGPDRNADDWTTRWVFSRAYTGFAVIGGDRLVGGWFSPGEGEIDALALPLRVPEPAMPALLAGALLALGLARRGALIRR